jgi:hypothetical protein
MLSASDIKVGAKLTKSVMFGELVTYTGTITSVRYLGTYLTWDMDVVTTCASSKPRTDHNKGYSRTDFPEWELYYEDHSTEDHKESKPKEKPCQVCSRLNDVGVDTCWSCGNTP